MARCRCSGEACSCRLSPGPGITLAGTGSPTDPWIISSPPVVTGAITFDDTVSSEVDASGAGTTVNPLLVRVHSIIGTLINFNDSDSVEWSVAGTGSEGDPLDVQATIPCIDCSLPGDVGDVLTLQGDGTYAPGPPVVAPVGEITVAYPIAGDGSPGNPLTIDGLCTYGQLKLLCAP